MKNNVLQKLLAICLASLLVASCSPRGSQVTEEQGHNRYRHYQLSWPSAAVPDAQTVGTARAEPVRWPVTNSEVEPDQALEQRAQRLLGAMSLEQKVGQIIQTEIKYTTPGDVRDYHLGSVLNGGGSFPGNDKYATPQDWVALADAYYHASMDTSKGGLAVPIIWGTDAVHGHNNVIGATLFPHNIGLGATRNPELMRHIGKVTAREVAATGIDWIFAPTVATVRDDHWGRTYEGYAEDPALVRDYAGEIVRGIQGSGEERFSGDHLVATAKHFIGDGGTDGGVDRGDTRVTERELLDIHGQGYVSALDAGVQTVMASFNSWNGEKLHGSRYMLTEVLKEQMGFDGFVVGDWLGHAFVPGCSNVSCPTSINAGLDMFMASNHDWKLLYSNTLEQARRGEIPIERLNDAVLRILRVKLRAGLFDAPPSARALAGRTDIIGSEAHREVARQAVRESLVLLKNHEQLLPLAPGQTVLVAGDGAHNIGKQSGGWTLSWQGTGNTNADFPGASSIFDGIKAVVEAGGGQTILSADGALPADISADVAIVVYGENPYAEMQGDLKTLEYQAGSHKDLKLLKRLRARGIPVVSVFLTGRPLWVNPELNTSDAFVVAWLPGSEGAAVADVLFRTPSGDIRHDFTGTLPYSWPMDLAQKPLNYGDPDYAPLFAYGFGLTADDTDTLASNLPDIRAERDKVDAETMDLFSARPMAPWHLFINDDDGAETEITGNRHAHRRVRIAATDRETQEDARTLEWLGGGEGSVYLRAWSRIDLSEFLLANAALVADVRLERAADAVVLARMQCGDDCEAEVDVSALFSELPLGEWRQVSVDLRCFADDVDFSKVNTPFHLSTTGEMQLTFSRIAIASATASHLACTD
ncbi:exo 1,3/1,4-beta-D-glucan glucohydrolase [Microbulbifer salipaludis]|uniref:Exo 1,3/1,4-beta-D-glucan glucohydrolase n=1 Tax=Microbulbifer salipaludis TaxID=187980 RepID=A0ABS3E2A8_9GAMM|nr:exo 1,3/1,4-beta-D-glucan glucohydrolase [Microbulbifer salipaludis]MBN8429420.1 exo 1,3/1,4-beta-D-glucan glucohydrolase [Microbulbifer salipaludis]